MVAAILAAAALIVQVGEHGQPIPGLLVALTQGPARQARLTDAQGEARFRCDEGIATVSLELPKGWKAPEISRQVRLVLGPPLREAFQVQAHRVLRGTAFLDVDGNGKLTGKDVILPGWPLRAGDRTAESGEDGRFALEGLPAGSIEVSSAGPIPAAHRVTMGTGELQADFAVPVARTVPAGWTIVPQPPMERALRDWAEGKPMTEEAAARLERLSAMTNLDPSFRLVLAAGPAPDLRIALKAATALQRYLTGPGLVARERLALVLDARNLARSGQLTLLLARASGEH